MKYSTKTGSLASLSTPCLICGHKAALRVAGELGHRDLVRIATQDFTDKVGTNLLVQLPKASPIKRILVAGGADAGVDSANFRKIVRSSALQLANAELSSAVWALAGTQVKGHDVYWRAFVGLYELSLALYRFDQL